MPSTKLINQKFQFVRRWLFPGVQWNDAPPDKVSLSLVNVVDMEHWVPLPRYMARVVVPAPGAGVHGCIQFENFIRVPSITGALGTAKPTRFVVTDLRARVQFGATANTNVFAATRQQIDFADATPGFAYPTLLNPLAIVGGVLAYSGWGPPFVRLRMGDIATANLSGIPVHAAGDLHTWVDLPDLEPGNGIIFQGLVANIVTTLELSWVERRNEGEDNVT